MGPTQIGHIDNTELRKYIPRCPVSSWQMAIGSCKTYSNSATDDVHEHFPIDNIIPTYNRQAIALVHILFASETEKKLSCYLGQMLFILSSDSYNNEAMFDWGIPK